MPPLDRHVYSLTIERFSADEAPVRQSHGVRLRSSAQACSCRRRPGRQSRTSGTGACRPPRSIRRDRGTSARRRSRHEHRRRSMSSPRPTTGPRHIRLELQELRPSTSGCLPSFGLREHRTNAPCGASSSWDQRSRALQARRSAVDGALCARSAERNTE